MGVFFWGIEEMFPLFKGKATKKLKKITYLKKEEKKAERKIFDRRL
jgi:hypothetical protein